MSMNVEFLGKQVSRMIVGDNPVNGHSYIPDIYSGDEMQDYYTAQNAVKALFEAEKHGINTCLPLANDFMIRVLRQYRNEGGKMNVIFQSYPAIEFDINLRMMLNVEPLGIYHTGSMTDMYCESGQHQKLRDHIKMVKDAGVLVGMGTHVPERVKRAEDEDWGADFYLTCLYNARKNREGETSGFISGKPKNHLVFFPEDRFEMFDVIKQVEKPCIAFKVFAGGQIFYDKNEEECKKAAYNALKETYDNIKPNDLVCMGVFQKYKNQIEENMGYVSDILG